MRRIDAVRSCVQSCCNGVCIVAVLLNLAACGIGADTNAPGIAADNPYAAEFAKNYSESTNPLVKGILRDGVITEAELGEFADAMSTCVSDTDPRLKWSWTEDGGESLRSTAGVAIAAEHSNAVLQQCYEKTDYMHIMPLHDFVSSNPDNLSADEYNVRILECMKSHDLIDRTMDPGYFLSWYSAPGGSETPEYRRYLGSLTDERDPNYDSAKSERFFQCATDPLGLQQ